MTDTHILGKDASLEQSIARFTEKLTALGIELDYLHQLNPVPNVYSVHIRDKHCPLCFTNGKGASEKAALASALGEYFERLSSNYFFADFYLGQTIANGEFVHYPNEKWFAIEHDAMPQGLMDDTLWHYFDCDGELSPYDLVDLQSGNADRGIVALPYVRQRDHQTVYIPQSIIANLYVSNGMSAGNSENEARVQALSEIFERFVKNKIISERISLPEIPSAVLARYPHIQQAIAKLEREGFPIYAFDASLGGQFPVICVVLLNPNNGTCFASFGAHPNFAVALERTVTELLQGRSLNDLDVFSPPSFADDDVADHANLETHFIDSSGLISWDLFKNVSDFEFVDWDFSGTTAQEFTNLMAIFTALEHDVYIMDYTHLGVYACRIIVPGMSDIYPVDDLLYANNNMGMMWRVPILALPHFDQPPHFYQQMLNTLDEQGIDDFTRVREFLGIAVEKSSAWYTLRIGELKAMLALAARDLDTALDWAQWTLESSESVLSTERIRYYRCLVQSLELFLDNTRNPEHYHGVFTALFTSDIVNACWGAIKGDNPFYGLTASDENLREFAPHQALLAVYDKLQRAKVQSAV
ncbi:30S ribosomal protein S12 methylthiotransferase accessory factor YcaO [Spirabiliibacterium falconis]|uniref:30S ribosomal protein S12 methylthiotransferase accessory factor YcaO n=1 Tax=Spirabiliibacterium falconis TaxID=572023 RepID=UPI001AAC5C75|nr:30S ribosomal protein S12 methylthiotransferase accessory factor YcaO [Spirabiliibacterium falconis]MBE2893707.1 30S ribosomal protein S12 methylthiotransferase accessory protein YcaO [Spirabiliibacterium falconis]